MLQPTDIEDRFPRVAGSYAELTIPRRQEPTKQDNVDDDEADLQLAAWFGGNVIAPGEDQVFEILAGQRKSNRLEFIKRDPNFERTLRPNVMETKCRE